MQGDSRRWMVVVRAQLFTPHLLAAPLCCLPLAKPHGHSTERENEPPTSHLTPERSLVITLTVPFLCIDFFFTPFAHRHFSPTLDVLLRKWDFTDFTLHGSPNTRVVRKIGHPSTRRGRMLDYVVCETSPNQGETLQCFPCRCYKTVFQVLLAPRGGHNRH